LKVIQVSDLDSEKTLSEIKEHLLSDGLIIYPTDTLYGIGCNFYSIPAQNKIDRIKGRTDTPYSVAVADREALKQLISGDSSILDSFRGKNSFSKLTLIFRLHESIDNKLVRGSGRIGVRLPDHEPVRRLLAFLQFPLVSTSVNRRGKQPLNSPGEIEQMISGSGYAGDTILINDGDLPVSRGSTIIDLTGEQIKLIREGDGFQKIVKLLGPDQS